MLRVLCAKRRCKQKRKNRENNTLARVTTTKKWKKKIVNNLVLFEWKYSCVWFLIFGIIDFVVYACVFCRFQYFLSIVFWPVCESVYQCVRHKQRYGVMLCSYWLFYLYNFSFWIFALLISIFYLSTHIHIPYMYTETLRGGMLCHIHRYMHLHIEHTILPNILLDIKNVCNVLYTIQYIYIGM